MQDRFRHLASSWGTSQGRIPHGGVCRGICLLPLLFCALLLISPSSAFAGDGFLRWLQKVDQWLEDGQREGIDTNYVDVPQLNHQVYVGTYGYWQNFQMRMPFYVENATQIVPGLHDNDRYEINAYTHQGEVDLGVDWKGLALELPFSVFNNYLNSLGLAKTGSVWGFRLRYKYLRSMGGHCNVGDQLIDKEKNALRVFYAEGYYVLNSRRFSLAAGLYADMVQKRSAGSPLFYVNYYQSRYNLEHLFPANFDSFRTQQLSLGAGYAYNLSLLQGRLLFHGSFVPMVSFYNHQSHDTGLDPDDYSEQWKSFYHAAEGGRPRFHLNLYARFAANYSWNNYILSMLVNFRHFGYTNDRSLQIYNQEADAQINACYRF